MRKFFTLRGRFSILVWSDAWEWGHLNQPRVASFPGTGPVGACEGGSVPGIGLPEGSPAVPVPGKSAQLFVTFGCYLENRADVHDADYRKSRPEVVKFSSGVPVLGD